MVAQPGMLLCQSTTHKGSPRVGEMSILPVISVCATGGSIVALLDPCCNLEGQTSPVDTAGSLRGTAIAVLGSHYRT
jgi:hypothetical protein